MAISLDYLPNHTDIQLYQDNEMFCINSDTMALGEFIEVYRNDVVLDIGTNNGALLLYANRFNPKKMIGIDINEKAILLAKKNMELNAIDNCELKCIDANIYTSDPVDVIIFNPPYFKTEEGNKAKNSYLTLAKHEGSFSLEKMISCINRNLKPNGSLYFLFQTARLEEVVSMLESKKLTIKKMQFVYDVNKELSNVFMIKAVKCGKPGMQVVKPLIIERKK